jgi:protein mago nashi
MDLDDAPWPQPEAAGRQELEVRLGGGGGGGGGGHVSLATAKLATAAQMARGAADGAALAGLRRYFFLCQDLKALFLALVTAHFQVQPI